MNLKHRKKTKNQSLPFHRFKDQQQPQESFVKFQQVIAKQKALMANTEELLRFAQKTYNRMKLNLNVNYSKIKRNGQVTVIFQEQNQQIAQKQIQELPYPSQLPNMLQDYFSQERRNKIFVDAIKQENTWQKTDNEFTHMKNNLEHVGFHLGVYSYLHKRKYENLKDSIPSQFQNYLREVYNSEQENIKRLNQQGWNIPNAHTQIQQIGNLKVAYEQIYDSNQVYFVDKERKKQASQSKNQQIRSNQ